MPRMTLIENEFASLWVHPEAGIVHHQFKRFIHGAAFREVLTKGCDALVQHKCTKWLSDDSGNSALGAEDEKWAQSEWFPAVKAGGWKHWAIVLPAKLVGQMNMKRFCEMYKGLGINANVFSSSAEAMAWLERQ